MSFPKANGVPVFVMLPLDTVTVDGVFKYAGSAWFAQSLHLLATSGAYGVAIDVWWGAVEQEPGQYTWTGYKQLFELVRQTGLKLQIVLSFHACGGNVGDTAHLPLPAWVIRCGENDPDLFFTDRPRAGSLLGQRNREYLSIWADDVPRILCGRSPMQCYEDFMLSFHDNFVQDLGSLVEELVVGAGPCGELRFPSYVEANGWRFPGVGEFQCYDRRALASLAQAARDAGQPSWGYGGPHDTGNYNSHPEETGFYSHAGSWDTAYGRFFLEWYSGSLLSHGDRLMGVARRIFGSPNKCSNPSSEASADTRSASPQNQQSPSTRQQQPGQEQPCSAAVSHGTGTGPYMPSTAGDRLLDVLEVEHSDTSMSLVLDQDLDGVCRPASGRNSRECQRPGGLPDALGRGAGAAAIQVPTSSMRTLSQRSDSTEIMTAPSPVNVGCSGRGGAADRGSMDVPSFQSVSMSICQPQNATCNFTPKQGYMFNSQCSLMDMTSLARDMMADDGSECMTPDTLSGAADETLQGRGCEHELRQHSLAGSQRHRGELTLTLKIAGIHWWFRSRCHAAELTAGYYNTATRDGYGAIVDLCVKHHFSLTLTCVEMCDTQHPPSALCGPEGLLKQVRSLCAQRGVPLSGENALPIFLVDSVDTTALERVVFNTRVWHGAALMAAYWSSRGQGLARSPGFTTLPPSPEGSTHGGSGNSYQPLQIYQPATQLRSAASVPSSYRSSESGEERAAGFSGSGSGRGCQLCPARSDPAIAATGLRADSYADISEPLPPMRSFTFLRLASQILQPQYQGPWLKFMWKMREGGFC